MFWEIFRKPPGTLRLAPLLSHRALCTYRWITFHEQKLWWLVRLHIPLVTLHALMHCFVNNHVTRLWAASIAPVISITGLWQRYWTKNNDDKSSCERKSSGNDCWYAALVGYLLLQGIHNKWSVFYDKIGMRVDTSVNSGIQIFEYPSHDRSRTGTLNMFQHRRKYPVKNAVSIISWACELEYSPVV